MKQFTTRDQFFSLSKKGLSNWYRWIVDECGKTHNEDYTEFPEGKLSIGIMIEFLDGKGKFIEIVEDLHGQGVDKFCDNLWRTVKEVLENE